MMSEVQSVRPKCEFTLLIQLTHLGCAVSVCVSARDLTTRPLTQGHASLNL